MVKILLLLTLLLSTNLFAHSGRTNEKGCHINKTTLLEHCHNVIEQVTKNNEIVKLPENHTAQLHVIPLQENKDNLETKLLENEQISSNSEFSAGLSAFYFVLVIVLICAFTNVSKTTIEFFAVINEKLESKTKFTIAISMLLTAITVTLVFLLTRGIF